METTRVAYVAAYVESCTLIDEQLRKSCARIAASLSERNRKYCELPATESFKSRIERPYAAYRLAHRDDIARNEASVAEAVRIARSSFERQFSQVLAGKVSMLDLESMNRELTGPCAVVEAQWLTDRKPK